ncbi:serine/threonine-protein phosphatase, partial [Mycobacterium tuberculosis]
HDNYTALTLWVIEEDGDDVTRLMPENVASTDP